MSITLVILCFLHGWRLLKEGGRERGFLYIALSVILLPVAVVFACFSGDIFLLPLVGVPYLLYCNKIPDTRMVQVILCLVPVVSIGLGVWLYHARRDRSVEYGKSLDRLVDNVILILDDSRQSDFIRRLEALGALYAAMPEKLRIFEKISTGMTDE